MKAIVADKLGGPEVLHTAEIKTPVPQENEVLVEVHASSVNPVDAKSLIPGSPYNSKLHLPVTPGMDVAGVVSAIGEGISKFKPGDKVYGQASVLREGSGAFAEYAVTSENSLGIMPDNISFIEAATFPLAAISAYQAIYTHMQLRKGQRVLIHGGSGGIGSFAIQLARHVGAIVVTTATGDGIHFVKRLEADEIIDYKNASFEQHATNIDAVLDTVGGEMYEKSFQIVKPGGIIVSLLEKPDEALMAKYNVNAMLEMTDINHEVLTKITSLIELNVLKTFIAETYNLDNAPEAFKAKSGKQILGKIAIDVAGDGA